MTLEEITRQIEAVARLLDNGYVHSAKEAINRLAHELRNGF